MRLWINTLYAFSSLQLSICSTTDYSYKNKARQTTEAVDQEDVRHSSVILRNVLPCVETCAETYHGAKRDGSGGVVVDSDEVDEESSPAHHGRDHKGPYEHLLDPSSACIIHKDQSE